MKRLLYGVIGCAAGFVVGLAASGSPECGSSDAVDVTTVYDTITVRQTRVRDSVVVRYRVARFPVVDDGGGVHTGDSGKADTVAVSIPIVQKHYSNTGFEAWVSGWNVNIDSLNIRRRTDVINIARSSSHSSWGLGVSVGVGWTGRGVSPYVGVGIVWTPIWF